MSQQIRVDSNLLIGSIVDFEDGEWMVEDVTVDPEAVYHLSFWDGTSELAPQSWLVTIRPATAAEKAEWEEWADTAAARLPPPQPWWRKVFS